MDDLRGLSAQVQVKEWPVPFPDSRPRDPCLAVTSDDRVWYVDYSRSHMMFDERTGQIWFGTDANTIGRAQVGEARAALR